METYQLDRILTWLSSAIGFNQKTERKFFYDPREKLFFNIGFNDNGFYEWTNQLPLSDKDSKVIRKKIHELTTNKNDFLEVIRSNKYFYIIPSQKTKTKEEYEEVEKNWMLLHKEVEIFLESNDIDVYTTRLIE